MNEEPGRPLDHATARIVSELAAALLPSLRETVASELAKVAETLSGRTLRAEEAAESLKRLQENSEAIGAALETIRSSAGLSLGVLPALNKTCERLEAAIERASSNEKNNEKPEEAEPLEAEGKAADVLLALRSLEAAMSDWEGVLRANGRAHTREFSEFAAEISELMKDMRVTLPAMSREAAEKALAYRAQEWSRSAEQDLKTEKQLGRIYRLAAVGFVFSVMMAGALAAAIIMLLR